MEIKASSQPGCDPFTELTENDRETDSDGLKVCQVTYIRIFRLSIINRKLSSFKVFIEVQMYIANSYFQTNF